MAFKETLGMVSQGMGIASTIGGALLGNTKRKQQMADQKQLMEIQQKNQMALNEQGQKLAQENWDYTNAENQRKHYEKAGLNVGLMYGGSGAGGTLSSGSGGGASSGSAPTQENNLVQAGGQLGMLGIAQQQLEMQKQVTEAQVEQAKAKANLDNTEAARIRGEGPRGAGEVTNLGLQGKAMELANALNSGNLQNYITLAEEQIKNLQAKTKTEVANGQKTQIEADYEERQQKADLVTKGVEATLTKAKTNLTDEQKLAVTEQIKQIKQDVINSIENTRSNTRNAETNRNNADTNYQSMMDNYSTKVKDILIKQGFLDNEELKTTMNNIMSIIGLAK